MTNEKRIVLLIGAFVVAALWFRAAASDSIQASLMPADEFGRICTNAEGSPVRCSEINEDAICIQRPAGAHSGTRIDCNTGEPIPANGIDAPGQGGAKYRSPY
jgi:hypothetical protein